MAEYDVVAFVFWLALPYPGFGGHRTLMDCHIDQYQYVSKGIKVVWMAFGSLFIVGKLCCLFELWGLEIELEGGPAGN